MIFFELCTSSAARATKNKSCRGKGSDLSGGLNSVPINSDWICSIRDPIDPGPEHRSKSLEFATCNLPENKAMEVIRVMTHWAGTGTGSEDAGSCHAKLVLPRVESSRSEHELNRVGSLMAFRNSG